MIITITNNRLLSFSFLNRVELKSKLERKVARLVRLARQNSRNKPFDSVGFSENLSALETYFLHAKICTLLSSTGGRCDGISIEYPGTSWKLNQNYQRDTNRLNHTCAIVQMSRQPELRQSLDRYMYLRTIKIMRIEKSLLVFVNKTGTSQVGAKFKAQKALKNLDIGSGRYENF